MVEKNTKKVLSAQRSGGIELYFKRIFALMFGAVGLSALTSWFTIYGGGIRLLVNEGGMSALFYIVIFGGLALSIWAQVRAFSLKPGTAAALLALYAVLMGFGMTPLIWGALAVNPLSILYALLSRRLCSGRWHCSDTRQSKTCHSWAYF